MPFVSGSKMDARRRLASRVLVDGIPKPLAALEAGVCLTTAKVWSRRAVKHGIAAMPAPSQRPHHSPTRTGEEIVARILEIKALHPTWGARKLLALLWPQGDAPVCERTVDRILKAAGRVAEKKSAPEAVGRFERESPNELWQIDFKGLGENPPPYKVLSVLDDKTRFLVGLERLSAPTGVLVFEALWNLFGEYGLPEGILSDNEHCFHSLQSKGPSFLEARLWRLGLKTPHGRARHPQTQGKVERFHRTLQETVGADLRDASRVERALREFREEYNWLRPHEAAAMKAPGVFYAPSLRKRPDVLPESVPPEGAEVRRVGASGSFVRKGVRYRVGAGLRGEFVALVEKEGELWVRYAQRDFTRLEETRV